MAVILQQWPFAPCGPQTWLPRTLMLAAFDHSEWQLWCLLMAQPETVAASESEGRVA
ncbi:hypothetical protein [Pseudidiomarina aquimaris]|uniref:hypothetical protein n=1 Tax=Pseudidiomarina aquimaris TaxID=641841 RepID=UPI003A970ECA